MCSAMTTAIKHELLDALPTLLPKAIMWAESQSSFIEQIGKPLNDAQVMLARRVGVSQPERIYLAEVDAIPLPDDAALLHAALIAGVFGTNTIGLTLGHGIYIARRHFSQRLLAHEFRHVYQYESAGSIAAMLPVYFRQIITDGYEHAALEVDARAHEIAATQ